MANTGSTNRKKSKMCPFRPQECSADCALYNGGYNACCIKLMAAAIMKMADFRKDIGS